jgi:putative adenylate-forming enzyme
MICNSVCFLRLADFWQYCERNSFLLFYFLAKYRFRRWNSKDILKYQESRIRNRVRFVMTRSEFYRRYYSGYDTSDIWNLPVTSKAVMMENLTHFNTCGLGKDEILEFCLKAEKTRDFSKRLKGVNVGMSSGTSGNKGVEITGKNEENLMRAAFFARFSFPKKQKINLAFILRVTSPAFALNRFGHRLTYITQLDSIENIVKKLNEQQPNIISAPPSMLKILAREAEGGRLTVNPRRLVSYAEVLYLDVRGYLRKVFNCEVHEIYKCSEGAIAITCRYGSLHVNEDMVAIQLLNRDGSPTTPGNPCHKLIITDLHKSTLPIIRYELNDIITISNERCRCGSHFRVIEKIQGRADDLFWGLRKTDRSRHFIYQDYISRTIISVSDQIEEFQAIQKDYEHLILRIKLYPATEMAEEMKIKETLISSIRKVFTDYNCIEPQVEVLFAEPLKNINSGKLSRVICEIKDV